MIGEKGKIIVLCFIVQGMFDLSLAVMWLFLRMTNIK